MGQKIFDRLIQERERLGMNKSEMALAGGVAKPTYLRYELGERSPDGDFFEQIASVGADVLYIITGKRSRPPESSLSVRAQVMLENYLAADDAGKRHIETTAMLLTQPQVPRGNVTQNIQGYVGGAVVAGDLTIGTPLTSRRKK